MAQSEPNTTQQEPWTTDRAADLYGIRNWGDGYFDVSEDGCVLVRPCGGPDEAAVRLVDIVDGLEERGLAMPVLLRFSDILSARIEQIHTRFAEAIAEAGYRNRYQGVYPIKVNQQEQVIDEIVAHSRRFGHGLETGSKAELVAAMAYLSGDDTLLVCNGYKDAEFVDLALSLQQMGTNVVLVVELPDELNLILDRAARLGLNPSVGVRAKLATQAPGHWNESAGDRSVFGLNAAQIVDVVETLKVRGKLECLKLLHFHLGSQISNIRYIRRAVSEASRFYVDLVREGAPMGYLDIGGGLAVDYDGTHSDDPSSANYGLREYAVDVVENVKNICDESSVPHPVLVSESGRATVAHHSVLLFNILDVSRMESHAVPDRLPDDAHEHLHNLMYTVKMVRPDTVQECYHDATYYRDEIRALFQHGVLTLRDRAMADRIFWCIARKITETARSLDDLPDELQALQVNTSDVYHGNFSVFQSLPDSWAIQQLFPVMPIARLHEEPERQAMIADITCDCDGKLDRFIDPQHRRRTLALHRRRGDEPYILGVFLVGAYQETLGDLHNLLGDTHVVNVRVSASGELEYDREISGDTVAEVLSYVEYSPATLIEKLRRKAEAAVRRGDISPQERRRIMQAYEAGLRGYTYFEAH